MEEKSPYKLTNGQPDFDDDLYGIKMSLFQQVEISRFVEQE